MKKFTLDLHVHAQAEALKIMALASDAVDDIGRLAGDRLGDWMVRLASV